MHSLRQRLARDEGFTLIELLVVLIIIGVLLAIAIPSYLGFQKSAQQTAAASDVRSAVPDAEEYYADNNNYTALSVAALKGYDSGLMAYSATQPGIVTAKGGATKFCISAEDAGNFAYIVGPGSSVVTKQTSDFCATWVAS